MFYGPSLASFYEVLWICSIKLTRFPDEPIDMIAMYS